MSRKYTLFVIRPVTVTGDSSSLERLQGVVSTDTVNNPLLLAQDYYPGKYVIFYWKERTKQRTDDI